MTSKTFPHLDEQESQNLSPKPTSTRFSLSDAQKMEGSEITAHQSKNKKTKTSNTSNSSIDFDTAIKNALRGETVEKKLTKVYKDATSIEENIEADQHGLGYLDKENYTAPQISPSIAQIPIEELRELSDKNPPVTKFGKAKKFRFLPATVFGKTALITFLVIGVPVIAGIYNSQNAKQTHSQASTVAASSHEISLLKKMDSKKMNELLLYMDSRAADSVNEASKNWHMVTFGATNNIINQETAYSLLQNSKSAHQKFLQKIKQDRDDIIIIYNQSINGEKQFFKTNGIKSQIDAIGSSDPISQFAAEQTGFEKFLTWHQRFISDRYYLDSQIQLANNNIFKALGSKAKTAENHAYMQIATGIKPQYQSILLDDKGIPHIVRNPETNINNANGVPDILSIYQNQMVPDKAKLKAIESAPTYDAVASKLLKIEQKFNEVVINNSNKNKP